MVDRLDSPYEKWAANEGIPIIRGYAVEDMYSIPLEPWQRKGGKGAFINLEGGEGFSSAYICEIPPKTSLKPQKHLFEERIYILQGKGETKVWNQGSKPQTFSWQEYGLFAPPLNTWHQHTNTGGQPAKYVAITDAPLVFNIYRNPDFVFNTNFVFKDRYNGEPDYFDGIGKSEAYFGVERAMWRGGLIPDVRKLRLPDTMEYGKGFGVCRLDISRNGMEGHLGLVDVGTYKKPHRHAGGAHLIVIQGTGFALIWKDWKDKVKADFKKGSLYSPPEGWWHTHCNTGADVVRHIAVYGGMAGIGKMYQRRLTQSKGGDMMERQDEPPELRQLFEEELARNGLKSHMPSLK